MTRTDIKQRRDNPLGTRGFTGSKAFSQTKGFTLIEVLVALSVLALGIASSAKILETGYTHLFATQNYTQAAHLAHSHLGILKTKRSFEELGPEFQTGEYDQHFQWQLELKPILENPFGERSTKPKNKLSSLFVPVEVQLRIAFENGAQSREFHSLLIVEKPMKLRDAEFTE